MYIAGNIDFSNSLASKPDAAKSLRFPLRIPLEKVQLDASKVSKVACGLKHMLAVLDGKLLGMGNNDFNQLGASVPKGANTYFRDLKASFLFNAPVKQICCGRRHSIVLTEKGEVFSTGDNSRSQLGHSNKAKDWACVRIPGKVVQIDCGLDTSFALTADGHIYSWGSSETLSLGHPMEVIEKMDPVTLLPIFVPIEFPTKIESLARRRVCIVEISVANEHFIARADNDDVYVCGTNSYGRLGTGNVTDHPVPFRIELPQRGQVAEKILQVVASSTSSSILKHNQDFGSVLYSCGKEGSTELGLTPQINIAAPTNITKMFGGYGSSLWGAITTEGKLLTWGAHSVTTSCLLHNDRSKKVPSQVDALDHVFVKDMSVTGGQSILIIADVQKSGAEAATKTVIVPREKRLAEMHLKPNLVDRYDEVAENFMKQYLGEVEGQAYFDKMEKAPPAPEIAKPTITKKGTSVLHVGSKVRLWMSDVYALGKVTCINPGNLPVANVNSNSQASLQTPPQSPKKTPLGGSPSKSSLNGNSSGLLEKNHSFEITWERDDWDPEVVDLYSDDETLDEENPNRWQKIWFLEAPEGA